MLKGQFSCEHLRQHALFVYGVEKGNLICEMRSSTEPKYYKIAVRVSDGTCFCGCPWFAFNCKPSIPTIYSGRVCRHIRDFREFLQGELHDLKTKD